MRKRLPMAGCWRTPACCGLLLALAAIGCGRSAPPAPRTDPTAEQTLSPPHSQPEVAAQAAATARPDPWAGYVADSACAECHDDISASYARHAMGNSVNSSQAADSWPLDADHGNPFVAGGFEYSVSQTASGGVHRQRRLTADGRTANEISRRTRLVVGSGKNGQSFLVGEDGYLFMSPITWYPQHGRWDLSPGYEVRNSEFHRPVQAECLFCHSNTPHHVTGSLNRFVEARGEQTTIGCQRCHGPGARHVAVHQGDEDPAVGATAGNADTASLRRGATAADPTIVNPGRLAADLREAVCQQCHLSGAIRVLAANAEWHDFRPGQPLQQTVAVYIDGRTDAAWEFVGHGEQMVLSQCYQGSAGQLGCISCHDPHQLPQPDERASFYRQRCLQCHDEHSCSMPRADRLAQSAQDNCVTCHMPQRPTEVQHAAMTDHRIPRRADPDAAGATPQAQRQQSWQRFWQLTDFSDDDLALNWPLVPLLTARDVRSASAQRRDLAVALVGRWADEPTLLNPTQLARVQQWLEEALERHPDDAAAAETLAQLWVEQGDLQAAWDVLRPIVEQYPRREIAWIWVARILSRAGDLRQAQSAWQQLRAINPWIANYWYESGLVAARAGQWHQVLQLAQAATERFPTSMGALQLLMESNLQLGRFAEADAALERMQQHQPDGLDRVRAWYQNHPAQQQRP